MTGMAEWSLNLRTSAAYFIRGEFMTMSDIYKVRCWCRIFMLEGNLYRCSSYGN